MIKIPDLPIEALTFLSPSDQAQMVLETRTAASQQRVAEALAVSEEADQMISDGRTAREAAERSREARVMLDKAAVAQQALEQAHENLALQRHGASSLLPLNLAPPPPAEDQNPGFMAMDIDMQEEPIVMDDEPIPAVPFGSLYHRDALQLWILRCCQVPGRGGLRDKPGKSPDYYHSCYCLSGLSSAQHGCNTPGGITEWTAIGDEGLMLFGPGENRLAKTNFLCNVVESKLKRAREFYSAFPPLV